MQTEVSTPATFHVTTLEGPGPSLVPSIQLTQGGSIETGARKFIVLDHGDGIELVIGRPMVGRPYNHKELTREHHLIRGGGEVVFRAYGCWSGETEWRAVFRGRSADFGVFDSRLCVYHQEIRRVLKTPVSFEWSGE